MGPCRRSRGTSLSRLAVAGMDLGLMSRRDRLVDLLWMLGLVWLTLGQGYEDVASINKWE